MTSKIVVKMMNVANYHTEFNEDVPVRNFDEIKLDNVRDLTPTRVDQILDNYWCPHGFIAWDYVGEKLQTVLFRGRAAVVTELEEELTVKEILDRALSLNNLSAKKVISVCA